MEKGKSIREGKKKMRALIAAGGTGGHVYPGLTLASYLREHNLAQQILFVGGKGGLESRIIPSYGFELKVIGIQRCPRLITWRWVEFSYGLAHSFFQSLLILLSFKPQIVIGMGSFHSYPIVVTASFLRIPSLICEQNIHPSLTNRFLGRWASKIAINFAETDKYLSLRKRRKTCLVGNPVRPEILKVSKKTGIRKLGLEEGKFTLLFLGGSQGAHSLNLAGLETMSLLEKEGMEEKVQAIFTTGKGDFKMMKGCFRSSKLKMLIFSYLPSMEYAYAASDLVISRSGAMTLSEITARGLPSILVPYPHATSKHQWENARALEKRGAAWVIPEENLSDKDLRELILKLMKDKALLKKMKARSKKLARPQATEEMARIVCDLASGQRSVRGKTC